MNLSRRVAMVVRNRRAGRLLRAPVTRGATPRVPSTTDVGMFGQLRSALGPRVLQVDCPREAHHGVALSARQEEAGDAIQGDPHGSALISAAGFWRMFGEWPRPPPSSWFLGLARGCPHLCTPSFCDKGTNTLGAFSAPLPEAATDRLRGEFGSRVFSHPGLARDSAAAIAALLDIAGEARWERRSRNK